MLRYSPAWASRLAGIRAAGTARASRKPRIASAGEAGSPTGRSRASSRRAGRQELGWPPGAPSGRRAPSCLPRPSRRSRRSPRSPGASQAAPPQQRGQRRGQRSLARPAKWRAGAGSCRGFGWPAVAAGRGGRAVAGTICSRRTSRWASASSRLGRIPSSRSRRWRTSEYTPRAAACRPVAASAIISRAWTCPHPAAACSPGKGLQVAEHLCVQAGCFCGGGVVHDEGGSPLAELDHGRVALQQLDVRRRLPAPQSERLLVPLACPGRVAAGRALAREVGQPGELGQVGRDRARCQRR